MWRIIYNLLMGILSPFFALFILFNRKTRRTIKKRFKKGVPEGEGLIWIHAASLGEGIIATNLIKYLSSHSDLKNFVVTTNTEYAEVLLERNLGSSTSVFFLPFDFSFFIRKFMRNASFRALILVETELWPNLVFEAKERGIPVIVVNGRISDSAYARYKKFSFFFKNVLSKIDLVLVQNEVAKERFIHLGISRNKTKVTGNLKYFRETKKHEIEKKNIITFGSVKEKEIDEILPVFIRLKEIFPSYKIFVAPRDLSLISLLEKEIGEKFSVKRYSSYRNESVDFVIIDTVGDLMNIYEISKVAFVGGSLFPYGGQNMLEPLFFGTPVLFGPHVENFRDIAEKIAQKKAGIMVKNGKELLEQITKLLNNENLRDEMGREGLKLIEEQKKVMEDTTKWILEIVRGEHQ